MHESAGIVACIHFWLHVVLKHQYFIGKWNVIIRFRLSHVQGQSFSAPVSRIDHATAENPHPPQCHTQSSAENWSMPAAHTACSHGARGGRERAFGDRSIPQFTKARVATCHPAMSCTSDDLRGRKRALALDRQVHVNRVAARSRMTCRHVAW